MLLGAATSSDKVPSYKQNDDFQLEADADYESSGLNDNDRQKRFFFSNMPSSRLRNFEDQLEITNATTECG